MKQTASGLHQSHKQTHSQKGWVLCLGTQKTAYGIFFSVNGRETIGKGLILRYMNLDLNQTFFLMSFRFDKNKPEDFGLRPCPDKPGLFMCQTDGSQWIQKDLYDYGWGNEYGFVRLPELGFEELWLLFTGANMRDNQYGAAFELESRYPRELLNRLWEVLDHQKLVPDSLMNALAILDLNEARTQSSLMGRNVGEAETSYQRWQLIKWKIELTAHGKHGERADRSQGMPFLFLILIFVAALAGRMFLNQLAEEERINTAIRLGRLAALPRAVQGLKTDGTSLLLLKFAAPRNQIEQFLKKSKGLSGVAPEPFHYSDWYNSHLHIASNYTWFDPATAKGRLYQIPSGGNGVNIKLIVDDLSGMVYIELSHRKRRLATGSNINL